MKTPAELLTLQEICSNRFFRIPDYQRGYSWEKNQLDDLRHDIENIRTGTHIHYTGTLVAASTPGGTEFEVVDGQQRLTTLILLLSEIHRVCPAVSETLSATYLKRGIIGNEQYVLTPNEETREFFIDFVHRGLDPEPQTKSHHYLLDARNYFRSWLAEKPENPKWLYDVVTTKLGFVFFTPPGHREIGIMFEVINNRGKELSELEKIKNFFIYYATIFNRSGLRTTINDKWKHILRNLSRAGKTSNEDENRFLRYSFLVFYSTSKENSRQVYDTLKERYNANNVAGEFVDNNIGEMERFVNFLETAAVYYAWLFVPGAFTNEFHKIQKTQIHRAIVRLRHHAAMASVMPLYLAVMHCFYQPALNALPHCADRVAALLDTIEILNFRLFHLPGIFRRADSKQADLFNFAHTFFRDAAWHAKDETTIYYTLHNPNVAHTGDIFDWLQAELREMILRFCPTWRMVDTLTLDADEEDVNYYNWNGLRFFLASYEEEKKEYYKLVFDLARIGKGREDATANEYLSIEHIWAQANRPDSPAKEANREKRRLGNLVLMGLRANIQQQDLDIEHKVNQLVTNNHIGLGSLDMHQVDELRGLFEQVMQHPKITAWSRRTGRYYLEQAMALCDLRENELIRFALRRWTLPGEDTGCFICIDSFRAANENNKRYYYLREPEHAQA